MKLLPSPLVLRKVGKVERYMLGFLWRQVDWSCEYGLMNLCRLMKGLLLILWIVLL
jgi:hypothetical protein